MKTEPTKTNVTARTWRDYLGLTARGFAMGAADVVPGVSGGTMAFILGIYEELIESIRTFGTLHTVKLFLSFNIKRILAELPWRFLLAVAAGILLAIFSLAHFLEWMLENHPVLLWSFFFGLVAASIYTVRKRIRRWSLALMTALVLGAVATYLVVGLVPVQTPDAPWFLFFSGAMAICAMILPGISGSFVLVLLGKYHHILSAVNSRDFVTLLLVAAGAVVGIITVVQFLAWLFKKYHDVTVAVLIGFMVGSLRKVWPWKETVSSMPGSHGEPIPLEQLNTLPPAFDVETMGAAGLAALGFAVVFLLEQWASRQSQVKFVATVSPSLD